MKSLLQSTGNHCRKNKPNSSVVIKEGHPNSKRTKAIFSCCIANVSISNRFSKLRNEFYIQSKGSLKNKSTRILF